MIDTIHFCCRRQLHPFIAQVLQREGSYQDDCWSIRRTTQRDDYGIPRVKIQIRPRDRSLRKALRIFGTEEAIELICVELPRMLHPGNGYVFVNGHELDAAIEKVHALLDALAPRGNCWTDTNRMDLVLNLPVDSAEVLNIHRSIRVLGLHTWATVFEEPVQGESTSSSTIQTLSWRGKEVWLTIYDKARLESKRSGTFLEGGGCLRVELRLLTKQRIARFLRDTTGGPMVTFDYYRLYRHLRATLCKLPLPETVASRFTPDLLLAEASRSGIEICGVKAMDWYRRFVSNRHYARKSRKIAQLALEKISWDWSKLLPPHVPPEQVHVTEDGSIAPAHDPLGGPRPVIERRKEGYVLLEPRNSKEL
jgi:hypothetical protein